MFQFQISLISKEKDEEIIWKSFKDTLKMRKEKFLFLLVAKTS